MMNGTGVDPTREPFISSKLKMWHAREFWNFIGERFQDHARNLRVAFEILPVAGTNQKALWAIPTPHLEDVVTMAVGDTLHALSCALDHLIYELFEIYGGSEKNARMPVNKTRSDVDKFLRTHGSKLPDEICHFILDEVKPYQEGGDHDIWAVRQLDNVDKHRLIIPYAAAAVVPVGGMQVGSTVAFTEASFIVNAIRPTPIWAAKDDDDLNIWRQSDIEKLSYSFRERDIFDADQAIGEFFVRSGSRIATLIDDLTDLVYKPSSWPRFAGHQGWRDHPIPKPSRSTGGAHAPSVPGQAPRQGSKAQLKGSVAPITTSTPTVDRWLRMQRRT